MKALLNWRYYVLLALFSVGALATMVAFSEPDSATAPSPLVQTAACLAVAIPSFYALGCLMDRWSRAGLIPEILTHKPQ